MRCRLARNRKLAVFRGDFSSLLLSMRRGSSEFFNRGGGAAYGFVAGVGPELDSESDKESELDPECGPVPEFDPDPDPEPDPERGSDLEIEPPVRLERNQN